MAGKMLVRILLLCRIFANAISEQPASLSEQLKSTSTAVLAIDPLKGLRPKRFHNLKKIRQIADETHAVGLPVYHENLSWLMDRETQSETGPLFHSLRKRSVINQVIRILYHFTCLKSGPRARFMKAHLRYDWLRNKIYYTELINIDRIDNTEPIDVSPSVFMATFEHNTCIPYHHHGFVCHYRFLGHLDGQIWEGTMDLQLMDVHAQPEFRRPSVVETCYYPIPNSQSPACPAGSLLGHRTSCTVRRADGWTPDDPDAYPDQ